MGRLKSFVGRHVLVTGAAGGIGSAVARRMFLEEGASVVLVDRNAEGLRELARELETSPARREGSRVVVERTDLSSGEEIAGLVERLRGERIDVLVNNAGIVHAGPFESMDLGAINQILAVNLLAVVRLTRGLVSRLRENAGGHIVNIASGAGLFGAGGLAAYAAAKFGVVGFSESLRAELAAEGIGVSVVCPGFVRTGIVANSLLSGASARPDLAARIERQEKILTRLGMPPARIARAVVASIRRNRSRVVVGAAPRALLFLFSLVPPLARKFNEWHYRRLLREGIFE